MMHKDFLYHSVKQVFTEYFKPLAYFIPVSRATLLKERKASEARLKSKEETLRAEMVAQREALKIEYDKEVALKEVYKERIEMAFKQRDALRKKLKEEQKSYTDYRNLIENENFSTKVPSK